MSDSGSVASTSNAFVDLLVKNLVPDSIKDEKGIILCSPQDRGDASLSVYLYDMKENEELKNNMDLIPIGLNKKKHPPQYMTLFYMLTAYSTSDVRFRSIEEQNLIGRVIQVLKDNSMINGETFQPESRKSDNTMVISMLDLGVDEKMRLWNIPDMAYKVSLFYKIDPVAIESNKIETFSRVKSIEFTTNEKEANEEKEEGGTSTP